MSGHKPLKFVLLVAQKTNRVYSMFLEGQIYICREWEEGLMKTFESLPEAQAFLEQIYQETGHTLTLGFLDYMDEVPFVESYEFIGRDNLST
jgi:hypothetical protein